MPDRRLIFPCGAYFPVKEADAQWLESAHRAKDGAFRISVYPGSRPHLDDKGECLARVKQRRGFDYDGDRAPCEYFCPCPRRRKEERGFDRTGNLGKYVSCFARLHQLEIRKSFPFAKENEDAAWYDITPPAPAKCPHCEEQRAYVQACKRAAKRKEEAPAREKWRKCPQCEQYRELTTDTGLCATCQLVKVVEENHEGG